MEATEVKKNGIGVAGFVLALIGAIFCWLPILNWICLTLGFIFSLIGVFKKPKGLAIAGLIISGIFWLVLIIFMGALLGASM